MVNWVYDLILWTLSILLELFFREVHPRGSWKVPRAGPVIFVVAPHANQVSRREWTVDPWYSHANDISLSIPLYLCESSRQRQAGG